MRCLAAVVLCFFLLSGIAIAEVGDSCLKKGNAYYHEGQWDKAIDQYQMAIRINPDHLGARQNLGLAYQSKRDFTHAMQAFEELKKMDPLFAPAYISLGLVYTQKGRYKDAEKEYRKAVELEPRNLVAHLNLAAILAKQKEYGQAFRAARRGLGIVPSSPHLHLLLANMYFNKEKYALAALEYRKALKSQSQIPAARLNLGMALARSGKFEQGLAQIAVVRNLDPNLLEIPMYLARVYAMRFHQEHKGWKEAVEQYRIAARRAPDEVEISKELGDILAENGQYTEARKCYGRVLKNPHTSIAERTAIESKMKSWPKEGANANVSSKL